MNAKDGNHAPSRFPEEIASQKYSKDHIQSSIVRTRSVNTAGAVLTEYMNSLAFRAQIVIESTRSWRMTLPEGVGFRRRAFGLVAWVSELVGERGR